MPDSSSVSTTHHQIDESRQPSRFQDFKISRFQDFKISRRNATTFNKGVKRRIRVRVMIRVKLRIRVKVMISNPPIVITVT